MLLYALTRRVVAVEPLSPDEIELTDFDIWPTEVEIGEAVTVSVRITNISDRSGSYTLMLRGDFMAQKTVSLEPGQSRVVTFEVVPEIPGRHDIEVNGQYGSFDAVEVRAPDIRLSDLTIEPSEVEVGETVYINVTATNYGDAVGSKTITCEVT